MAKLSGLIKIEGTLDNLTFYKSGDGHIVKTKSSVSGKRVANDPSFQRTRENNSEFGNAASGGKLLRQAVKNLLINAKDRHVTARATQVMALVKNLDATSTRGNRNVAAGVATLNGKKQLKNFDFNVNAPLGTVLKCPYKVNTTTGVITLVGLLPTRDIAIPTGATDVTIKGAWVKVDFGTNATAIEFTNEIGLTLNSTVSSVTLTPAAVPTGTGTNLFLLSVDFYQKVNGTAYLLNNGGFNSLCIIEVS
jgi:hypothetical protein